ncbi:MAG: ABC transporter permease, partial [Chloroflexota bacterium]
ATANTESLDVARPQLGPSWFDRFKRSQESRVLLGLVLLIILFSVMTPHFLDQRNLFNVARQVTMLSIVAFGMTVVLLTGGIDLSVGSVMAVAGVTVAALMKRYEMAVPLAVVFALLMGLAIGVVNGLVTNYLRIPAFIATLAMMTIARGLVLLYTKATPIYDFPKAFDFIGQGYVGPVPFPVILLAIAFTLLYLMLRYTVLGRYAYAIGGNAEVCRLSGINVKLNSTMLFAISGFCAGTAGVILASRMGAGEPTSASGMELDAIAAVVVGGTSLFGGKGTLTGTLLGAFLMGVLANGLSLMGIEPFIQMAISGVIIIAAVTISARGQ